MLSRPRSQVHTRRSWLGSVYFARIRLMLARRDAARTRPHPFHLVASALSSQVTAPDTLASHNVDCALSWPVTRACSELPLRTGIIGPLHSRQCDMIQVPRIFGLHPVPFATSQFSHCRQDPLSDPLRPSAQRLPSRQRCRGLCASSFRSPSPRAAQPPIESVLHARLARNRRR